MDTADTDDIAPTDDIDDTDDGFDPIVSPTTDQGPTREPRFVHETDEAAAAAKLAARAAAGRKRPNILVVLMDDVGWGDFGCYGGGVAVGAPTPHIDRLAREGLQLTSAYSEPSCTPSRATLLTGRLPMRHGLQRPPMYGEGGGLEGEVTLAELLSEAGYATQAVGKWHLGENTASQPQHVGFDDFYGFLSVSDMYTEWRDPYFFPEVVYSKARTEWIQNLPFQKAFVHASRGGELEPIEEVTLPVLSELDDRWAQYSIDFIERQAAEEPDRPWFLYHCTRGAHFDNYPHERYLGVSPAKHPYKDTIVELDDIVGRLVETLRRTGQLEDTLLIVTSDNGPEMETWPDAAYTPFRCAKGSTWEGGVRVPFVAAWPGTIDPGRVSDGLFAFSDLLPTALALAGAPEQVPTDRFIDGVDQTSFLLAPEGRSNRKHHYYWLGQMFSALRVGEYKFMLSSISDDDTDVHNPGGFTGVGQKYPYGRLYNLYLDPKETRSYLIRKLAYLEAFQTGVRNHVMTFRDHPPKLVMGLNV
ncbi:MAG TPA: arylsulfatase [Acidimicrobiales bacterium]